MSNIHDIDDPMTRRDFLAKTGLATGTLLCSGLATPIEAWAQIGNSKTAATDSKLVVIFLRGAVDGLNVVVPYADPNYYAMRPRIAVAAPGQDEAACLPLSNGFGLHPALRPIYPLWQQKKLTFVLNSGSPDPTRSHFEAQDYMEIGAPGQHIITSGWLNRLLSQLPDNKSPVRALNVGSTTPRILQGKSTSATYAPSNKRRRAALDNEVVEQRFQQMYGGRADSLGAAYSEGIAARNTINEKLSNEQMMANQGALPANKFSSFGRQLGSLIRQEPKVQVGFVALGGFDTHVNQGAGKGQLANQLTTVGQGLADLVQALGPAFARTTIVVMSEFGRTARENGNGGTDHGHGNVMWVLGGNINGGRLWGKWDGLSAGRLNENRDMPVSTDYRTVVAQIIGEQMRLSQSQLNTVFPNFARTDRSLADLVV